MRLVGSLSAWQNLKELEEQVIADQFGEVITTGDGLIEDLELNLQFTLTPQQVQKICGAIVGQRDRTAECQKFVQNWLMHSSVAKLTAYLGKPA